MFTFKGPDIISDVIFDISISGHLVALVRQYCKASIIRGMHTQEYTISKPITTHIKILVLTYNLDSYSVQLLNGEWAAFPLTKKRKVKEKNNADNESEECLRCWISVKLIS